MKTWFLAVAACAVVGMSGVALGADSAFPGNAAAGKTLSVSCAACHGSDGNSLTPQFPKLAGQGAPYILKELQDFKSGKRQNPIMQGMAAPLSTQQMENLAAYFSRQKTAIGQADPTLVKLGQRIYRGGVPGAGVPACMACHGPDGAGNPAARFPMLHGQYAAYVVAQLKAFKSGARANDPHKMMRDIAARMTDKEIVAVASYIQGLH